MKRFHAVVLACASILSLAAITVAIVATVRCRPAPPASISEKDVTAILERAEDIARVVAADEISAQNRRELEPIVEQLKIIETQPETRWQDLTPAEQKRIDRLRSELPVKGLRVLLESRNREFAIDGPGEPFLKDALRAGAQQWSPVREAAAKHGITLEELGIELESELTIFVMLPADRIDELFRAAGRLKMLDPSLNDASLAKMREYEVLRPFVLNYLKHDPRQLPKP